ncbi:MAG TPA: ATP-binding protein, partial [Bacillota bacterium]|nr:ATP-binding protein [Bacillota bacterium]
PALLDEAGLGPALKVHLEQVARRSGLQAELQMSATLTRVAPAVETACFRIAQEALTNVLRHAQASSLEVRLSQTEKMLSLSIRDNGVGCDKELALQRAQRGESLGWSGMRERAALVGGQIEFFSAPGEGTEIQASFPLRIRPADKTKPPEV